MNQVSVGVFSWNDSRQLGHWRTRAVLLGLCICGTARRSRLARSLNGLLIGALRSPITTQRVVVITDTADDCAASQFVTATFALHFLRQVILFVRASLTLEMLSPVKKPDYVV